MIGTPLPGMKYTTGSVALLIWECLWANDKGGVFQSSYIKQSDERPGFPASQQYFAARIFPDLTLYTPPVKAATRYVGVYKNDIGQVIFGTLTVKRTEQLQTSMWLSQKNWELIDHLTLEWEEKR